MLWKLADGVGIAPTQPGGSLGFRDRGITALPTIRNGQGGETRTRVLVPNWWPRANARLLLTLHPEKWLPDLDSHQDKRLNRPPCYFHTIWQWCCRQDSHLHRSD